VKLGYKYRVGKRGRGREMDSGVNRESLAPHESQWGRRELRKPTL